jgi:ABC-type polysaccharide/polyol phosphate export permease
MTQTLDATTGVVMPQSGAARWLALRTWRNLRKGFSWAWLDVVCQYRRSRIGPLWETINVLVMTLGITVVSSAVFGSLVKDQIAYVGLGVIVWAVISALITEGSGTFVRNREFILSSNLSIDFYVGRTIFKTLITFAHHFALYFVGLAVGLLHPGWTSLLAIPGIVLVYVNGYWTVTLFALLCARFRDLELIIRNLLQLAFFVTPIFWDYRHIASDRAFIVDYNVLFYLLDVVRGPLLGEVPPLNRYLVLLGLAAAGYVVTFHVYRRMRRKLAFFV